MSKRTSFNRFPVISLGAEYLVMGNLMRRNILAYKAPPNNEGYDLLCIHPEPHRCSRQLRVQVKSRLASDCDRGFPVRSATVAEGKGGSGSAWWSAGARVLHFLRGLDQGSHCRRFLGKGVR
jgi:hypothetical protein